MVRSQDEDEHTAADGNPWMIHPRSNAVLNQCDGFPEAVNGTDIRSGSTPEPSVKTSLG